MGHDFLTKNEAKLLYKPSGISLLLNNICIKTEGQSENSTFFIKHAHFPHINLHADHKTNNSTFQASPKDFMALFNMNQYEKALHFHQKHIDAFSAQDLALRDVEELNSTEFQSNLSTKVPKNQEDPKSDLAHLLQDERELLEPILKDYSSLFRKHKFQVGLFPHFRAEARMDETQKCHQKRRPM